jgi:TfoX/Sxy family transcriptional regulator of competence genes
MPKPGPDAVAAFRSLIPEDDAVAARPMFGNLAAFVNGNMFTGLFGEKLFVRVEEPDRQRLLRDGGSDFEPMPGRAMSGYATLPPGWAERPEETREWIARSLEWARTLPAKQPKKPKSRSK